MSVSLRLNNPSLAAREGAAGWPLGRTVILVALLTAAALFYAFSAVRATDISYQLNHSLEKQRELRETGRRLRVELNILRAPGRLERQGRRLGLVQPGPSRKRVLK